MNEFKTFFSTQSFKEHLKVAFAFGNKEYAHVDEYDWFQIYIRLIEYVGKGPAVNKIILAPVYDECSGEYCKKEENCKGLSRACMQFRAYINPRKDQEEKETYTFVSQELHPFVYGRHSLIEDLKERINAGITSCNIHCGPNILLDENDSNDICKLLEKEGIDDRHKGDVKVYRHAVKPLFPFKSFGDRALTFEAPYSLNDITRTKFTYSNENAIKALDFLKSELASFFEAGESVGGSSDFKTLSLQDALESCLPLTENA